MPERRAFKPPPDDVLYAFGASDPFQRLSGGQGQAVRSGDLILKPAQDDEETRWVAGFCEQTPLDGFRLPRPVRSQDGELVHDGWQAWEFLEGAPRGDRWPETVDVCIRFHVQIADVPRPDWLDRSELKDQWAIADKVAWGELPYEFHPSVASLALRLQRCLKRIDAPSQLIHGDFGGNVLFSDSLPPAVIDLSLYWRPAAFAVGVVVADAIVWEGANPDLIDAAGDIAGFEQFLARAELRRIIEIDAAHRLWGWDVLGELEAHLPLIAMIEACCR